jgi:hypothetical protein
LSIKEPPQNWIAFFGFVVSINAAMKGYLPSGTGLPPTIFGEGEPSAGAASPLRANTK